MDIKLFGDKVTEGVVCSIYRQTFSIPGFPIPGHLF